MKESPSVRARQTGGTSSLLPGFMRRKRFIVTLLTFAGSLLLLSYYRPGALFGWMGEDNTAVPFDEFQGMLYYLTKSDDLLPAQMDGSEAQNPDVWSGGVHWTPAQWEARLAIMRRENPVIVFSKTYCPFSKKAKAILAEYSMKKKPKFIEADVRPDGPKIKALLSRLTGQATFPNVVVGGKVIGGADRTTVLHESGSLKKRLQKAGAL